MKKFTRLAAAGLVFTAGLSLAACHPPHQQDSPAEKVDNASTFTGEAPAGAEKSSAPAPSSAPAESPAPAESSAPAEQQPGVADVEPTGGLQPAVPAAESVS